MSFELPKQVIALPRGVEADGSATIMTRLTGVCVAEYQRLSGANVVLLPGGRSIVANDLGEGYSDGDALRESAFEAGLPKDVAPELEPSSDTVSNLLTCAPFIDRAKGVTLIAEPDHLTRGLWAARFVLAPKKVLGLAAKGPDQVYGRAAMLQERALLLLSGLAFAGIKPGDIDKIAKRNHQVQRLMLAGKPAFKKLLASSAHYQ